MSSPSRNPENAAYAARVSEPLPVAPIPCPGDAAIADGGATSAVTATDDQRSSCAALTGSQSILVHAQSPVIVPPSPSDYPGAPVSPASPASPSAPPSTGVTVDHGDQVNKRPRPPLAVSKSNGPSLLTQALASARGIPHSTITPTDQHPSDHDYGPLNDHLLHSSQPSYAPNNSQDLTPLESRHGAVTLYPGAVSAPVPSQKRPEPSRTISSPTFNSASHSMTPAPSNSVTMASLTEVIPVTVTHPASFFMTRMRGRSLERTEKETRVHHTGASGAPLDIIENPAPNCDDSVLLFDSDTETNHDSRASYRAWRTERTVSMGLEKAWSIGTEDVVGHADGQVEKSIAEVLAGIEPTRSRKASHSLQFFKESLPADKVKRKEPKSSQQEKAPLSKEPLLEGQQITRTLPSQSFITLSPPYPINEVDDTQPSSHIEPSSFNDGAIKPSQDNSSEYGYFDSARDSFVAIKPSRPQSHAEQFAPLSGHNGRSRIGINDTELSGQIDTHKLTNPSNSITENEDPHEEGEESSEEKISSAVFLPHQSLEDSTRERPCLIEKVEPPHSVTRSSTQNDFHPWLVKADEPEAESECLTEVHHEDRPPGRKDVLLRGPDLPNKDEDTIPSVASSRKKSYDVPTLNSQPPSQFHEDRPRVPLEAIELIPYKHQVGGHTTIWRFSKRAVCKQLNNRENEFYEKIERYHRDLLPFLPRYIGVLNVTYQKQPRRKSIVKKDEGSGTEKLSEPEAQLNGADGNTKVRARPSSNGYDDETRRRVVSQSLRSGHIPVPTVTFEDNRHILPRSLLQPSMINGANERPRSASAATIQHRVGDLSSPAGEYDVSRPTLEDRHANSWGATRVNKRLRNEVFKDAFMKQPITVHRYQKPASYHRSVPRHSVQSKSLTGVPSAEDEHSSSTSPALAIPPTPLKTQVTLLQNHSDIGPRSDHTALGDVNHVKDVTGTSAPEADVLGEKLSPRVQKRRYSGSKLRRRPEAVGEERGFLKYFEDADDVRYRRDSEPATLTPPMKGMINSDKNEVRGGISNESLAEPDSPNHDLSLTLVPTMSNDTMEPRRIPRPVNPKEAQTQRDSRVEYFLLLEDLTAGMKRPCIMDLKMGTRQYGVEAGPKKRESQRRKCAETTSRELGVRVCGLQTWDAKQATYVFRDKYYGRGLKTGKELQDTLTMFLYDGVDYSSVLKHIPTILQKLNQLEATIRRLRGYRFYAASLLMFYDAGTPSEDNDTAAEDSTTDFATDTEDTWDVKKKQKSKAEIDFKMADFANSVTAGDVAADKPCPPKHPNEPDLGFLRGLATLRKYFLRIQKDVRSEMGLNLLRKHEEEFRAVDGDYDELSVSE